jgi:hypothetical protein
MICGAELGGIGKALPALRNRVGLGVVDVRMFADPPFALDRFFFGE